MLNRGKTRGSVLPFEASEFYCIPGGILLRTDSCLCQCRSTGNGSANGQWGYDEGHNVFTCWELWYMLPTTVSQISNCVHGQRLHLLIITAHCHTQKGIGMKGIGIAHGIHTVALSANIGSASRISPSEPNCIRNPLFCMQLLP